MYLIIHLTLSPIASMASHLLYGTALQPLGMVMVAGVLMVAVGDYVE